MPLRTPSAPTVDVDARSWRVLADGRARWEHAAPRPARAAALFVLGSVVALVSIIVIGVFVSQRASQAEALRDARAASGLLTAAVVTPALENAVVTGDPAALGRLDAVVRTRLLPAQTVRVKLWTPEGRVLYSDRPELVGRSFDLGDEERESLTTGVADAEVSDLSRPENQLEVGQGPLLEVYRPVRTPDGHPLLFEQYFRYSLVDARGSEVWRTFAPITVGAVALLQLCQFPLVWGLMRRLRRAAREREQLLRQAIDASNDERRRVAADVHDGVVQGLAGASFTLAGAAVAVRGAGLRATAAELDDAAGGIREGISGLRSMLVEIYPPSLAARGLVDALEDLATPLRARGVSVELDVPENRREAGASGPEPDHDLSPSAEALIFRVAQESLRNAARHSGAGRVRLSLRVADRATTDTTVLEIVDDGVGLDLDEALARSGHFGLSTLRDVVTAAGARLLIASGPGAGTRVRLQVPAS